MAPVRKVQKPKKRGARRVVRSKQPPEREETQVHDSQSKRQPVKYTFELSETICERIMNGETPTAVCRDPTMPTWAELYRWKRDKPDFARRFQAAREAHCEFTAFDMLDIADNATNDYVDRIRGDGVTQRVFDRENFERSRLRVDTRKWNVAKILRHVYGDKTEVDLRTPDGIDVKVEERNALIDAICKLVHPKADGKTKPDSNEEPRER